MEKQKNYWFPAKTFGWGWGFPRVWQGWLVLLAYLCGLVTIFFQIPPDSDPNGFTLFVLALSIVLVAICWLKGEPPRWRWGGK
ncbi:hypothetical protein INQ40_12780 [Lysobacter sp. H21R4]|uniref:hypothetical protein n=1 Tax=Lysobacter sp. H21R4 TaxID=2781021 RepID=UPI001887669E|nr:hypothetical protein [Lysobacter sp. H21R4]QOY62722.1 hypothetical protein INQ40_12780 [Lysobacter sp. H21R4]